jgi:hypothetical protein
MYLIWLFPLVWRRNGIAADFKSPTVLGYISSFPNSVTNSPIIISSDEFVNPPFTVRCPKDCSPIDLRSTGLHQLGWRSVCYTRTVAILTLQLHAQGVQKGKIVSIWGTAFFVNICLIIYIYFTFALFTLRIKRDRNGLINLYYTCYIKTLQYSF